MDAGVLFIESLARERQTDRNCQTLIGATHTVFLAGRLVGRLFLSRRALAQADLRRARSPCASSTHPSSLRAVHGPTTAASSLRRSEYGARWLCRLSGGTTRTALTELNAADDELEHGWPHALARRIDRVHRFASAAATRISRCSHRKASGRGCACRSSARRSSSKAGTWFTASSAISWPVTVRRSTSARPTACRWSWRKACRPSSGFGALGPIGLCGVANRHARLAASRAQTKGSSRLVRVERDGTRVAARDAGRCAADAASVSRRPAARRRLSRSGVMTREIRVLDAGTARSGRC